MCVQLKCKLKASLSVANGNRLFGTKNNLAVSKDQSS